MGAILEIIGWIGIIAVLAVMGLFVLASHDANVMWIILPWAAPSLFGSVMVIAFGQMVQHLAATRREAEKQTALLQQIADRRA
jgi:hypothetical protein